MAKKQKSFAEKASSGGNKDQVHIKFVKSVPSDREGFWRFNESMISMDKGQNLDAVLKQIEDEANMVDIEMPEVAAEVVKTPIEEAMVEEAPTIEEAAAEVPAGESEEKVAPEAELVEEEPSSEDESEKATETIVEEEPATEEVTDDVPAEDSSEESVETPTTEKEISD